MASKKRQPPARIWLVFDTIDNDAEGPFTKRKEASDWAKCRHDDGYRHARVVGPYVLSAPMKSEDKR